MKELSLNILDITENSVKAGASLTRILIEETADSLTISIKDDGCGMSEEVVKRVIDPFYTTRTTRSVGLGIPLFKLAAEMTGGSFDIESEVGVGTKTKAVFKTDHLDFTPLGDMCSSVVLLITMNTHMDFLYRYRIDEREFTLDTRQLKEILGDVPLNEPSIANWIKDYINQNTNQLTEV